jgi:GNAT superfamily N-acetyltransferase
MRPTRLFYWNPEIDTELIARMGLRFLQETRTGRLMSIGSAPTYESVLADVRALAQVTDGTVMKAVVDDGPGRGDVVGFAALVIVTQPFTGARYVDEAGIWVEPEARGNTLAGPQLIEASENWARHQGVPVLKMTAPPRSGFGRYLKRRGYELAEEVLFKRLI